MFKAVEDKLAKEFVVRGGSWNDGADSSRSAFRVHRAADIRSETIGFRCVRKAPVTTDHTDKKD